MLKTVLLGVSPGTAVESCPGSVSQAEPAPAASFLLLHSEA